MADFDLPFANDGERRAPTADEQDGGFGCGPASLALFNWMFWAVQSEIGAVISDAGLAPSNDDMTQLLQAIQAKIDAATGGGDTSTYLLLTQARTRLPIYPDVQNSAGHFGITSPATGQVRIPSGVVFQHRGIFPVTTVQADFSTDASKTYHLRWTPTGGFSLNDLANSAYNPTTATEADPRFDSKYDDMLIARIITNASNVPTITNLINRSDLSQQVILAATNIVGNGGDNSIRDFTGPLNWARTPASYSFYPVKHFNQSAQMPDNDYNVRPLGSPLSDMTTLDALMDVNRYRLAQTVLCDYVTVLQMHFSARA